MELISCSGLGFMCSLVKFVGIVLIMSLVRLGSQIPRFFIFSMLPFFWFIVAAAMQLRDL